MSLAFSAAAKIRRIDELAGLHNSNPLSDYFRELAEAIREAIAIAEQIEKSKASPELVELAREVYALRGDNDIEIDDDALTSGTDSGTWVAAWVWMPDTETEE